MSLKPLSSHRTQEHKPGNPVAARSANAQTSRDQLHRTHRAADRGIVVPHYAQATSSSRAHARHQPRVEQANPQVAQLQEQLRFEKATNAELQVATEDLSSKLDRLIAELDAGEEEIQKAEQRVASVQAELQSANSEKARLGGELLLYYQQFNQDQESISRLEQELKASRENLLNQVTAVEKAKAEITRLEQEMSPMNESRVRQETDLQAQIERLTAKSQTLQEQFDGAIRIANEHKQELANSRRALNQDLAEARSQARALQEQVEAQKAEIAALRQQQPQPVARVEAQPAVAPAAEQQVQPAAAASKKASVDVEDNEWDVPAPKSDSTSVPNTTYARVQSSGDSQAAPSTSVAPASSSASSAASAVVAAKPSPKLSDQDAAILQLLTTIETRSSIDEDSLSNFSGKVGQLEKHAQVIDDHLSRSGDNSVLRALSNRCWDAIHLINQAVEKASKDEDSGSEVE